MNILQESYLEFEERTRSEVETYKSRESDLVSRIEQMTSELGEREQKIEQSDATLAAAREQIAAQVASKKDADDLSNELESADQHDCQSGRTPSSPRRRH